MPAVNKTNAKRKEEIKKNTGKLIKRTKKKKRRWLWHLTKTESFVDHAGRIRLIFQDGVTRMQKSFGYF